jgi:hypothetical protein
MLGAGVVAMVASVGSTVAAANPSGAPPEVYVSAGSAGDTASTGEADAFNLPAITAASGFSGVPVGSDQAISLDNFGPAARIAISADSTTAAAICNSDGAARVVGIDTRTGATTNTVDLGEVTVDAVAADPANSAVFVVLAYQVLYVVNLHTASIVKSVPLLQANSPFFLNLASSLAVTNDGSTAYVGASGIANDVDSEAILDVALGSGSVQLDWVGRESGSSQRVGFDSIVLGPDNKHLAASDTTGVLVFTLPLAQSQTPLDNVSMQGVQAITIGPGGRNVYAVTINPNENGSVEAFALLSPSLVNNQTLQSADYPLTDPRPGPAPDPAAALAEMPDGHSLLVVVTLLERVAGALALDPTIFDVVLGGPTASGPAMTVPPPTALPTDLSYPSGLAVTPDQAPHAQFSGGAVLSPGVSNFDAGSSTVKYGTITNFTWSFGDGTGTTTTNVPAVSHAFTAPGTYTVTVSETDSAATGVPPAFGGTPSASDTAGQTPYRLASNSARVSHVFTVTPNGTTTSVVGSTTSTTTTTTTVKGHPRPSANPVLSIEPPTVGPPGSVVTVTGKDFPNNAIVTVEWSTANASSTAVKVKAVHGKFTTTLLILVPDLLGKREAIAKGYAKANKPAFLVVATSEEPGGPSSNPVFRSEGP